MKLFAIGKCKTHDQNVGKEKHIMWSVERL